MSVRSAYVRRPGGPIFTVGHRGALALAPENTIAAFEAGARCGVDAVEFDVQRTRDGVPIVIHDETLDRTTNGSGKVRDRTLAEVRVLDAGSHFGPRFAGERLLTLAELLEWARGRSIDLVLELKQPVPASGETRDRDLASNVVALVRRHELLDRTLFISFDHPCIAEVQELEPAARTGLLTEGPSLVDPLASIRALPLTMGLHVRWRWISSAVCEAAHAEGMHVHAWGLGRPLDADVVARLVAFGVDSLSADDPCALIALLRDRGLR